MDQVGSEMAQTNRPKRYTEFSVSFLHVLFWNSGWFFCLNKNLNVHFSIGNSYSALKKKTIANHFSKMKHLSEIQHYSVEFFGLVLR